MTAQDAQIHHDFADVWAVHAERDGQPWLRDWARSEAEANQKMAALQASDENAAETEYWVIRMTKSEVESFQAAGVIPGDV